MTELMLWLPGLALTFTAPMLGLLSPGPSVLAIIGTSMAHGRTAGLSMAAGVGSGSTVWAALTVSGLSALMSLSAQLMILIKILGGTYVLWLALKAFLSAASSHDLTLAATPPQNQHQVCNYIQRRTLYIQGLMIHLTNPKAIFVWLSIAALSMQPDAPIWVAGVIIAGTLILSCTINMGYAVIFSTKPAFAVYAKARRGIQTAIGVFFSLAGLKLLLSRA